MKKKRLDQNAITAILYKPGADAATGLMGVSGEPSIGELAHIPAMVPLRSSSRASSAPTKTDRKRDVSSACANQQ